MNDANSDPAVSVENSLLGLSLLEGMLDPAKEETYSLLLEQHSSDELVDLLVQFALQWLAHESRTNGVPMVDYLAQLRMAFLEHALSRTASSSNEDE